MATSTYLLADSQRVIIYPNYIDSKKKVSEGRRIPLDKGEFLARCSGKQTRENLADERFHSKPPLSIRP